MSRSIVLVRLVTWMFIGFLTTPIFAQQSLIRTYTVGDGLVMNRIRGFHQDKDGFIWMYTWDGLSRYEGYRFRNYIAGRDLQHSFVNDILELPDGTMYLPLNDGSMAVMRNQEVDSLHLNPGAVINSFCSDEEGRIYAATDDLGVGLFENGKLTNMVVDSSVRSVLQIINFKDHFFFIGPYMGPSGVFDKNLKLVAAWHGQAAFYNYIYKDRQDRIFVCTKTGLKQVVDSSSIFILKDASIVPDNAPWKNWNINTIIQTPESDFWIGTSQGLIHLQADQSWTLITVQDGLLSNHVSALFLDRSKTLWIGTDAGAASINLQTQITNNRDLQGVYLNFVLPSHDGSVYVVSGNTFISHIDKQMNIIHEADMSDGGAPLALIPGPNMMWLIHQSTIYELNPALFPFYNTDPVYPTSLYVKNHGKFWITSGYGFQCGPFPGALKVIYDSSYIASSIAPARNNQLLIGTFQNGIFLARSNDDPNSCALQKVRDFDLWLKDSPVRSLMTSKQGDIWVGTRFSGLVRLQCNEDYSDCSKQSYTIPDGLVSNWITSLMEDKFGNIWVGSASGIDKLVPREQGYYVFPFSRINGYYANVRHLVTHPDGSLWVGHNEGLTRIIDGRIDTMVPPRTFITEVTLGGKEYPTFNSHLITLRYNQNSAHFAFSAPDYINSQQLMFTYRLAGSIDTGWSQPVRTHEIFYGNLTPGKFRFEVAAFGWNGERSAPVSYAFEILKPFWKQTWFILLAILLISIAVFALYRFRIAQMQHVQSVRDRIAADLHDDIASSLTHINILSEIGKQQRPGNGGPDLFERIGSEVQNSSEALDDIIWSVRTRRDSVGDVLARMRQYAAEIFEPVEIQLHIKENVEGIQSLEMEFKRDFYLVYKELLRNILKHAEATRVDIDINVNRTRATFHISDNGKGFDIDMPTQRSGLFNIKERVKKWNGTVSWNTGPEKGTKVTVEMQPG